VLLAAGVAASCGGEAPTGPDPIALPLRPGLQVLTLTGFAFSADPAFPPCVPAGQPRDGTAVATVVNLTADGSEWVARSASPTGTVVLRLRGTGVAGSGYSLSGTITGYAADLGLMGVVRDVTVALTGSSNTGAATVDGATASSTSQLVVGRVTGELRFADSRGTSSTCAAIQWSMQPY
jgi:hypothetical protein